MFGRRLVRLFASAATATAGVLVSIAGSSASSQALAPVDGTELVSLASSGGPANGFSYRSALSPDGRFVAFTSEGTSLVPGDTNGFIDIFVRDRQMGATERVSVDSFGGQGNNESISAVISGDGRFVAFQSRATNLVPGDTNAAEDVFVHDRQTGTTERVSVRNAGGQAPKDSIGPSISGDGRFVSFSSQSSNLVPGDTNGEIDVFVRDRLTGTTERISVGSSGAEANGSSGAPDISPDGRFVAFGSGATNLVPGDTNGFFDIFVRDRQTGATYRASVNSSGGQGEGGHSLFARISADGRFVAFYSFASNLGGCGYPSVYVHDRQAGSTECVGPGGNPSISADGRFVAFGTYLPLVPDDTNNRDDVFVYDRQTDTTARVSVDRYGGQAFGASHWAAISADGRLVGFESNAANLVPNDTNPGSDVFVRRRHAPKIYSFAPASGITGSGMMIEGLNFDGTTSVELNGRKAKFNVLSPSQMRLTVPSGATSGRITVTNPDGTAKSSNDYTVTFSITEIMPKRGPVGTVVTLTGLGFSDVTSVSFHGVSASFTILSSSSIRATVPDGATTGQVRATSPQGRVSGPRFSVTD